MRLSRLAERFLAFQVRSIALSRLDKAKNLRTRSLIHPRSEASPFSHPQGGEMLARGNPPPVLRIIPTPDDEFLFDGDVLLWDIMRDGSLDSARLTNDLRKAYNDSRFSAQDQGTGLFRNATGHVSFAGPLQIQLRELIQGYTLRRPENCNCRTGDRSAPILSPISLLNKELWKAAGGGTSREREREVRQAGNSDA
jgi:hypothetical protein